MIQDNQSFKIDQLSSSEPVQVMKNSVVSILDWYDWVLSHADPRTDDWPLMSRPAPIVAIFLLYLYIANKGPKWMENRKPWKLRSLLIVYNLSIAYLNLWICLELIYCSYKLKYRSFCQLVKRDTVYDHRIANVIWWYWASKGFEFADTLFFILRKKNNQLSFLHKYHHSTMFVIWHAAARYVPGGSTVVPVTVNSLVHVIMYSYYGLSAIPSIQKYLWWKKYITIIQLIQFFVGVSIGTGLIITGCPFTPWMQWTFSAYAFSFIILFGNFYLQTYTKGSKSDGSNFIDPSILKSLGLSGPKSSNLKEGESSNNNGFDSNSHNGTEEPNVRQRKNAQKVE